VSDLLSRPDEAEALARKAAVELRFRHPPLGRFPERDSSDALHRDMITTYSAMIFALHGGSASPAPFAGFGRLRRIFSH
jgi:hypothetical protein